MRYTPGYPIIGSSVIFVRVSRRFRTVSFVFQESARRDVDSALSVAVGGA